ncbi:MAG: ABC transporter ATP-binding protein [Candidatus Rokuibacteriota bacterium]
MTPPALQVTGLVKVYRRRRTAPLRAVDGLSFDVRPGSIFGLLGPNGAGKTTTLKILNTLVPPTSGHASVLGYDVARQGLEVRRRISVVLQESAAEMFLSVRDNLLTYGRFFGIGGPEARRRADAVLARFQLETDADRKVMDLSGGQRRRVQVAKVFLVDTPVVFMDEFSTGMDPILKRAVMDMLRAEAARGRTIVLTTQILGEAEELCDDILIVNHGREVARGDVHAPKLLGDAVKDVSITFERLPDGIDDAIRALAPLHVRISQNTVEIGLRMPEAEVLDVVRGLAGRGKVLRLEVSGASLEDVFVGLMGA